MKYEQEQRDIEHKQEVEQYEACGTSHSGPDVFEDAEEYDDGIHNGELHLAFVPRMNKCLAWHDAYGPGSVGSHGACQGKENPFRVEE